MEIHRLTMVVVCLAPVSVWAQDVVAQAALTSASQALSGATAPTAAVLSGMVSTVVGPDQDGGGMTLSAATGLGSKTVMHLSAGDLVELQVRRRGAWWGADGVVHKMARQNLQASFSWFFPALLVNEWLTDPKLAVTSLGADQRNGVAVQHLQCKRTFLDEGDATTSARLGRDGAMDLYLDSATFLPVTLEFSVHPDGTELRDLPVSIAFSDYRDTGGGGQAPYHIQKFLQGTLLLDITVSGINLNPSLSAADFAIPQQVNP